MYVEGWDFGIDGRGIVSRAPVAYDAVVLGWDGKGRDGWLDGLASDKRMMLGPAHGRRKRPTYQQRSAMCWHGGVLDARSRGRQGRGGREDRSQGLNGG